MITRPTVNRVVVVVTAIAILATGPPAASAGPILDYRYAGVVTDVYDPYGVFGAVAPGDPAGGGIRYGAGPIPPPVNYGALVQYDFPVTPGGGNLMTATVGGVTLASTHDLFVQVYAPAYGIGAVGADFQFADADASRLSAAGLPAGYTLSDPGAYVGLFTTDLSLSTFPYPPAGLAPLAAYDSFATNGFLFVDVRDPSGGYVDTYYVLFAITGIALVPEPASWVTAGVCLMFAGIWFRQRAARAEPDSVLSSGDS